MRAKAQDYTMPVLRKETDCRYASKHSDERKERIHARARVQANDGQLDEKDGPPFRHDLLEVVLAVHDFVSDLLGDDSNGDLYVASAGL